LDVFTYYYAFSCFRRGHCLVLLWCYVVV
jgi:hypothetical protein